MGLFITIEGIDGCGKSTQITRLHKNLIDQKYSSVVLTREPGGTPISEKIRNLVLGVENSEMSPKCELLLYLASRAQHVAEKIIPEMKKGSIVLSDRFEEATFAYQGFGRDMGEDTLLPLNTFATGGLIPDLTIILDITVEESAERLKKSGKVKDRLETNDENFFHKVRGGYLTRSYNHPGHIKIVDGSQSVEYIEGRIMAYVTQAILTKELI